MGVGAEAGMLEMLMHGILLTLGHSDQAVAKAL